MSENRTIANLLAAFAGESQANRKYLAYAKKAEAEGKMNAAKLFRAAADAEAIHAYKEFEVAGKIGATADNLKPRSPGRPTSTKMYPPFAEEAEAAKQSCHRVFTYAKKAEEVHARLYQEALENLDQTEEVFYYLCPVCGNIENPGLRGASFAGCRNEIYQILRCPD